MPIGPAAKGIIIVGGVIIAAGIAVYENPQFREWLETNRRKASEAFNEWLDSLDPQRRRQAQAYGATPDGHLRGAPTEGTRRAAPPPSEEFALERRRQGEEYLEQRKRRMEEYREKKRRSSTEPLIPAGGPSDPQPEAETATATARESEHDTEHLRQRVKAEEEPRPEVEQTQNNSSMDMSNARIQISFSHADIVPEVYSKAGEDFSSSDSKADADVSTTLPAQETAEEGPSTPRLSAQPQPHPEPEFSTPVLSLDLSQNQIPRELYQTAPTPEAYNNRSLPHTPSTAGSEVFFSRPVSDIDVDESASQRDIDMLSDVGPETPSQISRTSSFGHIDEAEYGERNIDREDDVVSVASSWSAVSSRVSER